VKVCFLSSCHPALDKRVFDKEAVSLARVGFDVVHLCPAEHAGRSRVDDVDIVTYTRRPGLWGRLINLVGLYRMASALDAHVYHCNEVDSWVVGAFLAIMRRKICIVDIHEDYPSTISEGRFPRLLRPLIGWSLRLLYRGLTPFTAAIVVAKRSVAQDFAHAPEKIVEVRNFVPQSALAESSVATVPSASESNTVTLIHLGLFSRLRGWPQLLEAMARLGPLLNRYDVRLKIIGEINDGSFEDFWLKSHALDLSGRVFIQGWMRFGEAFEQLVQADIGLVLFQPGIRNHVFALPHKMFDYMLAGLPIIIPEIAEEIRDIVSDTRCGLLVDSANPESIANALKRLIVDPELRREMGARGRKAVLECYNWEAEAQRLIDLYRKLQQMREADKVGSAFDA
jgi:glycosyltransferase involved in cell wall biosynthesis